MSPRPPMPERWTDQPSPSSWIPAVHLLLEGFSKTAMGMGLLLGQLATMVEHRSASLPRPNSRDALTVRRVPAALSRGTGIEQEAEQRVPGWRRS